MTEALAEPALSRVLLVARFCLAMVFLVSGLHKTIWFEKAKAEFRHAGVTTLLLPPTIVLHVAGSLALISGVLVREAALALALFTVVATLKVHAFWRLPPDLRLPASRIALAHLGLTGGLLLLAALGGGQLRLQV